MTISDRGTLPIPDAAQATRPPTDEATIDTYVEELAVAAVDWVAADAARRVLLVADTRATVAAMASEWVEAACAAKRIVLGTPVEGEEWQSGPWAVLRNLRLLQRSLADIASGAKPSLPSRISTDDAGRRRVRAFPTDVWDRALFAGVTGTVVFREGVDHNEVRRAQAAAHFDRARDPQVKVVLGAGNVSSIAAMDALYEIFVELRTVVLKMNPVNDYLGPIYQRAFRPLIDAGVLRIVYGGGDVGSYLVHHPAVDAVHMTGSDKTYETIMFGGCEPSPDATPVTDKPITAELGNVTPVIVVPGAWSDADLDYQAENLASWLSHNAGFNCIASRVLLLHEAWDLADRLLDGIEKALAATTPRHAYYPGAADRYGRFAAAHPDAVQLGAPATGALPWMLVRGVAPGDATDLVFTTEAFTSVVASTALAAPSVPEFLESAITFANDSIWGSLGASVVAHPQSLKDPEVGPAIRAAVDRLEYGTVAVNAWSGFGYALTSTPWGAFPGHQPHDIQSGTSVVHNTFMLGRTEKTIVEAPWREPLKPTWFPSNRRSHHTLKALTYFEAEPGVRRLLAVMANAIRA